MAEERTVQELTDEARDTWNAIASGWERNADFIARTFEGFQRWLIDHLEPKPGQTILELGAGPGDTGFEAARRVADGGRLISTDIAPDMVEAARRRAETVGITNADFRLMDAQQIDLDNASVDGVIHRFGPMLLPDPAASAAEVRRVLVDGGRYVAAVWAGGEQNQWIPMMGLSLVQHGIQPPGDPFGPGGIFSLGDPDVFRRLLERAGFAEVVVEAVDQPYEFADFDELWRLPAELAGPISVIIGGLPSDQLQAVKATVEGMAQTYATPDGGYLVPAQAICALAR